MKDKIKKIEEDRNSGSTGVLSKLIEVLSAELKSNDDPHLLITEYLEYSKSLERTFAVVHHYHNYLREGYVTYEAQIEYRNHWKNYEKTLNKAVLQKIDFKGKTILLHSHSGTILSLMEAVSKEQQLSIIQTESRPRNEGRQQAEELNRQGHHVTLVPDFAAGTLRNEYDLCILGADALFEHHFVNKVGSYAIASLCQSNGIPVIVVADPRKRIVDDWDFSEPQRSSNEVWDNPDKGILVFNQYFETVPNELTNLIF